MSEATITVLGVYKPLISAEVWQEQRDVTASDDATRAHFDGLVLIEALAENITESLKLGEIGQMQPEHPNDPSYMQVPYEEGLLSADGEALLAHGFDWESEKERGTFRFGFYLHFYDPSKPLTTPFGEVVCPAVAEAPVRLMMLLPYTVCS